MLKFAYIAALIASAALLIYEVILILKRNRTVKLKGTDDLLTLMIIISFAMILLSPRENYETLTAIASSSVLLSLLATLFVKRGLSSRGIEKFGYYRKWEDIEKVLVEKTGSYKVKMTAVLKDRNSVVLYFPYAKIRDLVYSLQQKGIDVLLGKDIAL